MSPLETVFELKSDVNDAVIGRGTKSHQSRIQVSNYLNV